MGLEGDTEQYLDISLKRPGQGVRYAIDDTKRRTVGWSCAKSFDKELADIVKYYKDTFIW
jgi:dTDP-D-glucose 4,6-dehydratase